LNGTVVPARNWQAAALAPGDSVEIVKPFGGG
jgi:thiamine biosynthesis protein ThiS